MTGTAQATDGSVDGRISLAEVRKLLRQMMQIAALRKQAAEAAAEAEANPCQLYLLSRRACIGNALLSAGLSAFPQPPPPPVDVVVSDDNASMTQDYEAVPAREATGDFSPAIPQSPEQRPGQLLTREQRREHVPPSSDAGQQQQQQHQQQQQSIMTARGSRLFPRFLGKTILNRPIRVEVSRGPSSGKRALDCIRKCIVEGGLHPVQCHSIC